MKQEPKHYAGFAAMVGRPNVGKSTLTNSLIGEKIAIMSDRPQTTRNKIMCIMNTDNAQIMFLDTPVSISLITSWANTWYVLRRGLYRRLT